VTHQGPTVGYRIEERGKILAYLPDHEPSLGVDLSDQPATWISGYAVACDADLLFHDAQYGDREYPDHIGWGHSALEHVVQFARKSKVDTVALFHHDPYHTDDELEQLLNEVRPQWTDAGVRVLLAREGMAISLDSAGVSLSS
jgi:ribonuclease BN (tRNA processing enzyme)